MALAIGKVAILVGAGLVGSVLAKEGRMPTVSDVFSGAYKVFFKGIKEDNTKSSSSKPRNDSLMAQVDILRQELQLLASNRQVTFVTSTGSGSRKYGLTIIVIVVGYGYLWWKGWRLSDMMFATKRGLFDACNSVGKELDNVHLSLEKTRHHVSSRIKHVDRRVDDITEVTATTQGEVSELREEVAERVEVVQSINHTVRALESRLISFEKSTDWTTAGMQKLLGCVWSADNSGTAKYIQAATSSSSRPALEMLPVTPSQEESTMLLLHLSSSGSNKLARGHLLTVKSASLPPIPTAKPPSPSPSAFNGSSKRSLKNASIATGLKVVPTLKPGETSEPSEWLRTPTTSKEVHVAAETSSRALGSGLFGRMFSGNSASILTRTPCSLQSSE